MSADTDTAVATAASAAPRRAGWWRTPLATVLIVLAALLALLSVVARWAHDEVGDTDRYVETVGPLVEDPAVQQALAARLTNIVLDAINLPELAENALTSVGELPFVPDRIGSLLPGLAGPISEAGERFVTERIALAVQSDAFADAWVDANRAAHTQMVAVLTGQGTEVVDVSDGTVSVSMAALIQTVKQRLLADGFALAERIPDITDATFTIFASADLARGQRAFALLDAVATYLPWIALGLGLAAIAIARDRRRAVIGLGVGIAIAMLVLGIGLTILRGFYLGAVPDTLPPVAAASIFDQLVSFLRSALRAVGLLAIVVALAALLSAPTGTGASVRNSITSGVARLRGAIGVHTGGFGEVLAAHRTVLRWAIAGLGAVWYVALAHPTGRDVIVIAVIVVIALVLLELLASPPAVEADAPEPTAATPT